MRSILALATLAMLTAGPAVAQTEATESDGYEPGVIIGERPSPQVMVVISRKNLEAGYTVELRESFLPQIIESVESGPF